MKKVFVLLVFLTYVYRNARFRECKGCIELCSLLKAVCVVKQAVYSAEIQKLYCGDMPSMIMVSPVKM